MQHHPQDGLAAVHECQVHRVLAGALQKILGAIEGVQDPEPLRIQGLPGGELLLGGLLAEQGPTGIGIGLGQPLKQPLVHRQIRRADGSLAPFIHAQGLGKAVGGLLPAAVGQQDVRGAPAEPAQIRQKLLLLDARGEAGGGGHHGRAKEHCDAGR